MSTNRNRDNLRREIGRTVRDGGGSGLRPEPALAPEG